MTIRKYIPDAITSMNLACGTVGVVFAFESRIDLAFMMMLAAAVFDFFDGFAARALGAYSDLGKELDSLSDLVSFGVLPSVMMYNTMVSCTWSRDIWCMLPLILAVFSGIRLAKFNVDERQHLSFIGLPTPMAALLCASMCCYVAYEPWSALAVWCSSKWFLPVVALVLSVLLLSEIPMFSMKFAKGQAAEKVVKMKRISFLVEAAIAIALVFAFGLSWPLAFTAITALYILKNVAYAIFKV